jgi:DNA-binding CsgD family transcriptional regulator
MTRLLFIPNPNILLWLEEAEPPDQLVESVLRGTWQPPAPYTSLAGKLDAYWQEGLVIATAVPLNPRPAESRPRINRRSREILKGLLDGLTTNQIALQLGVQPRTVLYYIAKLKKRFGAVTRAELIGKAKDLL